MRHFKIPGLLALMGFVAFCATAGCRMQTVEAVSAREVVICVTVTDGAYPYDFGLVLFDASHEQARPRFNPLELRHGQWCTAPLELAPGFYPQGARFDLQIHGSKIVSAQIYSGASSPPNEKQAILITAATRNRSGALHVHLDFPPEELDTAYVRVNPVYHPARLVPPQ